MDRPAAFALNFVTRHDRHAMVTAVTDLVARSGGWVADAQFFSNAMVAWRLRLPASRLAEFMAGLRRPGLTGSAGDQAALAAVVFRGGALDGAGSLQIRFLQCEPDLRRPIPASPG